MSMGGIFFRSQALDNGTLFEPHVLAIFHFDWHCSGVRDNSGFKVMYDGGEISRDCMEPVLSGLLYAVKKYGSRGKTFQPILVF
jgi:hypothetical protein